MNKRYLLLGAVVWTAVAVAGRALDTVKTAASRESGEITAISPTTVTIKRGSTTRQFPVNQIVAVLYDGEPKTLNLVRTAAAGGRFEDALKMLAKIDADKVDRTAIRQDIDFYKVYCTARLALAGNGEVKNAGKQMVQFVRENRMSYHWLKANEIVGDLLVASRLYPEAAEYYAVLTQAPWPEYKMRAAVLVGRARLAEGKPDEALKSFEEVLGQKPQGPLGQAQQLLATLGKARCLAARKKQDEAIKLVEAVIAKADPEQVELHARAYNTLGTALRQAERTEDALLAFLHVDVLYFSVPEAHAEALANLAELWNEVHKPQRALKAQQTLQERYKNSRWATQ